MERAGIMQVLDPPSTWAGLGGGRVVVRRRSESTQVRTDAICVLLGPGRQEPDVLLLDAMGDLLDVREGGLRRRLTGLTAVDADPRLLAAAYAGGPLHLESARKCTTVALPEDARLLAVAGADVREVHLVLIGLSHEVWLLEWDGTSDRVSLQCVMSGRPKGAWLFGQDRPLMAIRVPWASHDRMLLWQVVRGSSRSTSLVPLPGVPVGVDAPTGLRHRTDRPMVLAGNGTWLHLEGDRWCESAETLPAPAVPTRIHGTRPAFEPRSWASEEAPSIADEVGGRAPRRASDDGHALPRQLKAP